MTDTNQRGMREFYGGEYVGDDTIDPSEVMPTEQVMQQYRNYLERRRVLLPSDAPQTPVVGYDGSIRLVDGQSESITIEEMTAVAIARRGAAS